MILYGTKAGKYYNLSNFSSDLRELKGDFGGKIYVNLTNKCPCACTFCLRNTKEMARQNTLWLDEAPTVEEIEAEFKKYDLSSYVKEIVFCGFGEPTMRLKELLEVAAYIKKRCDNKILIRVNTNGLCDLIHKTRVAPLMKGLVDTISISLNASNAEEYLKVTRSTFGIESYNAMLKFAADCKDYIPNVVLTVVDIIGQDEVKKCQAICDKLGVKLRVRPFEAD